MSAVGTPAAPATADGIPSADAPGPAVQASQRLGPARSLLAVSFLSSFNAGILIPVLPLYFMQKGLAFSELGSLFSVVALGTVGVQLLASRHARLFSRVEVLAPLLLAPVVTFPMYLWVDSLPEFALVASLGSVAGAAAGPGLQVRIASLARSQHVARMYARFGLVQSFSYAGGVLAGGSLLAVGYAAVFQVGTVLSLAGFLVMMGLVWKGGNQAPGSRLRPGSDRTASGSPAEQAVAALAVSYSALARSRARLQALTPVPAQTVRNIRWATLHLFLFSATLAIYPVYFPRHLLDLGLPVGWVGAVVAASWILYGLAQPLGARYADRTGHHRWVIVGSLAVAAALNLAMATLSLWWVVLAWALLGIADGLGRPVTSALWASGVAPSARGSIFGWTMAAGTTAQVVSPLALSLIVMSQGVGQGLVWVSIALWVSVLPVLWFQRLPHPAPAVRGLLVGASA